MAKLSEKKEVYSGAEYVATRCDVRESPLGLVYY